MNLINFIRESNRIEGITREPTDQEIQAHEIFLDLEDVEVVDLQNFVRAVAGKDLRDKIGMNVRVGSHIAPPGGIEISNKLKYLLKKINQNSITPYQAHQRYETLHPFMDGNGRSGRTLWLWHMHREYGVDNLEPMYARGFLHTWYYQSLSEGRK